MSGYPNYFESQKNKLPALSSYIKSWIYADKILQCAVEIPLTWRLDWTGQDWPGRLWDRNGPGHNQVKVYLFFQKYCEKESLRICSLLFSWKEGNSFQTRQLVLLQLVYTGVLDKQRSVCETSPVSFCIQSENGKLQWQFPWLFRSHTMSSLPVSFRQSVHVYVLPKYQRKYQHTNKCLSRTLCSLTMMLPCSDGPDVAACYTRMIVIWSWFEIINNNVEATCLYFYIFLIQKYCQRNFVSSQNLTIIYHKIN